MSLSDADLRLAGIDLAPKKEQRTRPQFIAYVDETSLGCDYTIACGKTLWELKAQTKEEALLELKDEIIPPLESGDGVREFLSVTLYQVSDEIIVPIEDWYSEREEQEEIRKEAERQQKERLEYERLKRKFEE